MFKMFKGFYSRIVLICIGITCTVSVVLASMIGSVAAGQERLLTLKKYDIAINDLYSSFYAGHRGFRNSFKPLFESPAQYAYLTDLLRGGATRQQEDAARANVAALLNAVNEKDDSSLGILLRSESTGTMYLYDPHLRSVKQISPDSAFPDSKPFTRISIGSAALESMGVRLHNMGNSLYGLGGTLIDDTIAGAVVGQMVILYSVSDFVDILDRHHLDPESIISITDEEGSVIFRSYGPYDFSEDIILAQDSSGEHQTVSADNGKWEVARLENRQYGFSVSYQVLAPKSGVYSLMFLLAASICVFSVLAYSLALRSTVRKVRMIQKGMIRISAHDLDYRIPDPGNDDEFAQIIRGFNDMCDRISQNVQKLYIRELEQKKAELYAMQTSINPHFLFNTLELIRVHILHGSPQDGSRMLLLLSKIYHSQLGQSMNVSLAEELEHCENLIILHQYRFGNFEYFVDIPGELVQCGIPKNTLQPLIENYFVHGLNPESDDNLLTITAERVLRGGENFACITVEDNGRSISVEKLNELRQRLKNSVINQDSYEGFALHNVNSRLRIVFGEGSGLTLGYAHEDKGFKIEMLFRIRSPEELNAQTT